MAVSCNNPDPSARPTDVLSPEQMVNVQIAIHIAEAKVSQLQLKGDTVQALYSHYQQEIFKQYKIDSAYYRRSFRYYTNRPEEFDKIYEAVVDSLGLRESKGIL